MSVTENEDIINIDTSFTIKRTTKQEILDSIDIEDDTELKLIDLIIDVIENTAAKGIKDNKAAQIPYIGTIRKNPVKEELKKVQSSFKFHRSYMTKEQYKGYVRETVIEIQQEQERKDKERLARFKVRRNNGKTYDNLYKKLGKSYAEMYIYSMTLFKVIEFDAEWEEHYKSLKG